MVLMENRSERDNIQHILFDKLDHEEIMVSNLLISKKIKVQNGSDEYSCATFSQG